MNWLLHLLARRHDFYHEAGEAYIKCDCGAVIEFDEEPPTPEPIVDYPDENAA